MPRFALLLTTALVPAALAAQQPGEIGGRAVEPAGQPLPDHEAANVRVAGAVVEPVKLPPDLTALRVPRGYRISMWATELGNARMRATAPDGTVYVTRRAQGDVLMLKDIDRDGRAETRVTVARRAGMHGIALDGRTVFLVTQRDVYTAPILADGAFGPLTRIIDDLPDTGQHSNRTIAVGPDGWLYLSVGSTCNACTEASPESAAMLRVSKDGKSRSIFATGLRNTIGFDWHPETGELWGFDHGIDWLGDTQQREELNKIEHGKSYGWPFIYGDGGHNPQDDPPGDLSMADWDRMSVRPAATIDAHAAPMQMAFYRGANLPAAEQGNGFAAFRGSWNRKDPSGYDIRRVRFDAAGSPVAIEPFVTGFLDRGRPGQRGRLAGLAVHADGSLLFSDDENGVIYRVAYEGRDRAAAALPKPIVSMPMAAGRIALQRAETQAAGRLSISAPAFRPGTAIPQAHSAYYEDVSPALNWGAAPAGTRSFVLIMDDPDAASAKPVNHWLAWNIPATTMSLPEGVPTLTQLPDYGMTRQGRNTRGSIGYFGPRPPIADKPHRYHFQLLALDTMLNILPGSDRETLLAAMRGHVLAKGEVIGTYRQATRPPK